MNKAAAALQAAWDLSATLPPIDFTAAEANFLTAAVLEDEGNRFWNFVKRIAAWTDDELAFVDARQVRHVAAVVLAGADPTYPPFAPVQS
jgi:hypothetical protein